MTITFWGTRGSIPTPGRKTEKYGGNTTCLEIRYEDLIVVFDAGTGIREMSLSWDEEFPDRPVESHLILTHLHWDHIQGFPFFTAGYKPGNVCTIHGQHRTGFPLEDLLSEQMHGAFFPVPLAAMRAKLKFTSIAEPFSIGPVKFRPTALPHPGGCLGFRLEVDDTVFVLATDSELDQVALNREEIVERHDVPREYDAELLEFFRGADLVVIDCQYTDEEYLTKRGWGHNSVTTVVDLCRQIEPEMVALTHHDPLSTDERVTRLLYDFQDRLDGAGVRQTLSFAAREGIKMNVKRSV